MASNKMRVCMFPTSMKDKAALTLHVSFNNGSIALYMDREEALGLAAEIRKEAERLPLHRLGTPADLGCEVL